MQSYIKNRVKLWEQIEFKGQKLISTVFSDFRCILYSVRLQECKVHLSSFKTSSYRKILAKNYL